MNKKNKKIKRRATLPRYNSKNDDYRTTIGATNNRWAGEEAGRQAGKLGRQACRWVGGQVGRWVTFLRW